MIIDEAIEVLNLLLKSGGSVTLDTNRNAVKLGIEALKRTQMLRRSKPPISKYPLPGETKD